MRPAFSRNEADELLELVKQCRSTARSFADATGDPEKIKTAGDADDTAYVAVVDWVYSRTQGLMNGTERTVS